MEIRLSFAHPHAVTNLDGRLSSANHKGGLVNMWYVSHKKESRTVLDPMNPILSSLYLSARPYTLGCFMETAGANRIHSK